MESNVTMFEETIYNVTYPLYATYMSLFGYVLTTILVIASSSFIIHIILKNKELRNTNNMLIINLLLTDIIWTLIICCIAMPLLIAYLAGLDVYQDCDTIAPLISWLVMSTRMMILPPAAYRFICVARPFTHSRILTKRRIIIMIIALWVITIVPFVALRREGRMVYIPSLGACAIVNGSVELGNLLALLGYVVSSLLTIASGVYLRHKILQVNAYIRELHQCGMDRGKLTKFQSLKELLTEQVKPTIGVIVVGGVDALCNLLIGITIVLLAKFATPITQFQLFQTVIIPYFIFNH